MTTDIPKQQVKQVFGETCGHFTLLSSQKKKSSYHLAQ
jgi:hypothetical protein